MRPRVTIAAAVIALSVAATAEAAFDLRRATPESLGAVSADLPYDPLEPLETGDGLTMGVSRASLYQVDGLAADRIEVGWSRGRCRLEGVWSRAGTPDLAETARVLSFREGGPRSIRLHARAERLTLGILGEPGAAGWAAGGGAEAAFRVGSMRGELTIDSDRIARSAGAVRLGLESAALFGLRIGAGDITILAADRWERSGRISPRIGVQAPLGPALSFRAGRAEGPGRIGIAISARWGRLAISAGRQDDANGGVITAAAVT